MAGVGPSWIQGSNSHVPTTEVRRPGLVASTMGHTKSWVGISPTHHCYLHLRFHGAFFSLLHSFFCLVVYIQWSSFVVSSELPNCCLKILSIHAESDPYGYCFKKYVI